MKLAYSGLVNKRNHARIFHCRSRGHLYESQDDDKPQAPSVKRAGEGVKFSDSHTGIVSGWGTGGKRKNTHAVDACGILIAHK